MKITTFNPLIVSTQADDLIKLFEELGFEKHHRVGNAEYQEIQTVRMTDSNGFHVDVTDHGSIGKDMMLIRMNVDNFEEAYELLTAHGFTNAAGRVFETGFSKSTMLVSPSGVGIDLIEHKKHHDSCD